MDKKAKKRSLSETSLSIKSNQKHGNTNKSKKSSKRAKLAGFKQNGHPTSGEKTLISKVVDKQKKEQNKIVKQQSSIVKPSETKRGTKEKTKITIVKPKEETVSKTSSPSKKRRMPYSTLNLTAEQITKKIEEIRSREVLSKRAKKILRILNKKLKECANDSKKLDTAGKKSNQKTEHRANALMKNRQKANDDETKIKKKPVQSKKTNPQEEDEDEDDSDVEEESDEDESDESDAENKLIDSKKEEIDDESDEAEEDEEEDEEVDDEEEIEDEEEEEGEEVEDKKDEEDEEETEDEEDEENEEDEEDKIDTIKKAKIAEIIRNKKKHVQNKNKHVPQSLDNEEKELKKKRYILFVDNLPFNVTEDEIKQHFLTKIDTITNIRIPTKSDKTQRGYAYVEVTNNIDFEKGLLLNHTFLKKRKINVDSSLMENPKPGTTRQLILSELRKLRNFRKLADGNQKKKI